MNEIKWEQIAAANAAIKTTDIKDKDYAEVNQRVKAFRMCYPTGLIETEIIYDDDAVVKMRAKVGYYAEDGHFVLLATGTAFEVKTASYINKTSYIENCETSAVGRALGLAGFGIDTSICSAEELQNALAQQEAMKQKAVPNREPVDTSMPTYAQEQLNHAAEPVEKPKDTKEEAQYRMQCLRKIKLEKLDKSCMNHFGTDFAHTPVSKLMPMLPVEMLDKMEDLAV